MPSNEMEHLEMQSTPEHQHAHEIIVLAPNGLGFGEGSISTAAQLERNELSQDALRIGGEIIQNDPDVFAEVDDDANDDGCGDGRPAARVYMRDSVTGEEVEFAKSRRRAKLFGGGLVVASSMYRTVTGAPSSSNETILEDRIRMADALKSKNIAHGAHTDTHAQGEASGCGAIDKYAQITVNAVVFRDEITATLQAMYGDTYDENAAAIEHVFTMYDEISKSEHYFSDAAGQKTMDLLLEREAIIKQLGGGHQEDFVVLNDVPGTTFDQRSFDEKLKAQGIEEEAQAFVVDAWRGRMYAEAVAEVIGEQNTTELTREEIEKLCYADFMIRTLAVAGTLTGGDLPVYGRLHAKRSDFGLSHALAA